MKNELKQSFKLNSWQHWIQSVFLFGLWAAVFAPVYPSLVFTWLNHSNNSHGILVPIISAYLIWQKRSKLMEVSVSSSSWGLFILIVSMILYLLSYAGSVAVVSRAMIVFSLMGLILFVYGKSMFSVLLFPVAYLFFMIPVPDSIYGQVAFPLQLFASKISTEIIQAFSIPAYREGNMLYFAQTQLEVAEACSGLRSMMSFVMLGCLFAYLMKLDWIRRSILVGSAVPLAIVANIVRVTGTGILAHFYGEGVARGFLHKFSGLAVFAFGFVLLFGEYMLLEKSKSPKNE